MTRLIIAPEPAAWLEVKVGDVVVAPWASRMPGGVRLLRVPGWRWLRAAASRLGEPLAVKRMVRRGLDALVSRLVTSEITEVVAPSLGAQQTFARLRHARRVLMMDLPQLLQLHDDLDFAARSLPYCSYLRHHRAGQEELVQQLEECQLATNICVRGQFAQRVLRRAGLSSEAMVVSPSAGALVHDPASHRVLLAGSTASRSGLEVALEAISARPDHVLLAREAAGSHPSSLQHPQLRVLRAGEACPPVEAVWAPSWVEQVLPEVAWAAAAGVPLVATERALGWVAPGALVRVMKPGEVSVVSGYFGSGPKRP